jgi:hypothetical protein
MNDNLTFNSICTANWCRSLGYQIGTIHDSDIDSLNTGLCGAVLSHFYDIDEVSTPEEQLDAPPDWLPSSYQALTPVMLVERWSPAEVIHNELESSDVVIGEGSLKGIVLTSLPIKLNLDTQYQTPSDHATLLRHLWNEACGKCSNEDRIVLFQEPGWSFSEAIDSLFRGVPRSLLGSRLIWFRTHKCKLGRKYLTEGRLKRTGIFRK